MEYIVLIEGVDYTEYATLSISEQRTLDESLDIEAIKLSYIEQEQAFKPLTSVIVKVVDSYKHERVLSYFVSSDNVSEIISQKKYKHELALIEQTKWLERFVGITKTNTKPLINNYEEARTYIPFIRQVPGEGGAQFINTTSEIVGIKSPMVEDKIIIKLPEKLPDEFLNYNHIVAVYYEEELIISEEYIPNKTYTFNSRLGRWRFKIILAIPPPVEFYFDFYCVDKRLLEVKSYTITEVINDLLITAETLNATETPRFSLNKEQAEQYALIKAPDFNLKGTLWECLSEVGKFIHAIPRLQDNVIYFEELGQNKITDIDLENYCSHTEVFDIEQYATNIISNVDNIVNTDEEGQGSLTAPFANGYKTVRTEVGDVLIEDNNIIIETLEPIEKVIKLECGYLKDGRLVGDITPYVFENAEYLGLSEFDIGYPLSRNFAVVYTQGSKNIEGLSYKAPNAINPFFAERSIINIIARKLGVSAESIKSEDIKNLQFKLVYIPVVSASFKQSKPYTQDLENKASILDYNQSANKVNSFAYGESMKGAIARLGNPEITKVYMMNDLSKIPKVGDLFNKDYYISVVKIEYFRDFFKLSIALSKDFNKLNEYVGINTEKRFYEISEKQAVDRNIIYEDYCVVGENYTGRRELPLVQNSAETQLTHALTNQATYEGDVDIAIVKGTSLVEENLTTMVLPVISIGVGNSLVFTFHYEDNYSAGNTRKVVKGANLQYQTRYTDILGRIEQLGFNMGKSKAKAMDYTQSVELGNKLPIYDYTTPPEQAIINFFETSNLNTDLKLQVRKDTLERLSITYQVNFVVNDKSFVLGSALTRRSPFVTSKRQNYQVYVFNERLNKFNNNLDLTKGIMLSETFTEDGVDDKGDAFIAGLLETPIPAKSWALVTQDGELAIGRNIDLKANDRIKPIHFAFTHKIEKEKKENAN